MQYKIERAAILLDREKAEVLRRMAKGSGGGNLAARYTSHADKLDVDREAIRRILGSVADADERPPAKFSREASHQ